MSSEQRPLRLRIEKPIYGGAGLARNDGKAIFIPYTLPGELVSATVTYSKASFAEATLDEVIEPSPDRIDPRCPYFGVCGGCHYQHASYPAQLAMKAAILEETLTRAHLTPLPKIITHAGEPFGYRNRIRLHLEQLADRSKAFGYRIRASHRLVAVDQCPIAAPELQQALGVLAEVCAEQQCGRSFSQVELSMNHDGSELLLALWLRGHATFEEADTRLAQLCEALQPVLPALRGACVQALAPDPSMLDAAHQSRRRGARSQQRRTGRESSLEAEEPASDSAGGMPVTTWGVAEMTYKVGSLDYRVSLGAFFQVNRNLLETLVELATGGRSGTLAWDLYAGVGLFSRVLAQQFSRVVAVEGAPVSSADLRFGLAEPHQAVRSSTLDFLRRAADRLRSGNADRAKPDFVLVDPPRAGLGEGITRLLAQIGPPDITYVSCDPATLSRDLRALVDSGYKLQQLHLIDLFPQTFHLETVAMLSRR